MCGQVNEHETITTSTKRSGGDPKFTLVRGMKIRLLVTPKATMQGVSNRNLMSKAWHLPIWVKNVESQEDVRFIVNVRRWTRARGTGYTSGGEPLRQPYAPSAYIYRFTLGLLVAEAAMNDLESLFECANGNGEDEEESKILELEGGYPPGGWDFGGNGDSDSDRDSKKGPPPPAKIMAEAARRRGDLGHASVTHAFGVLQRTVALDRMLGFPRWDWAGKAKKWLKDHTNCDRGRLICGRDWLEGFARFGSKGPELVYSDMGSILRRIKNALYGCGLRSEYQSSLEIAKAIRRFVGGGGYVQFPFLWWPAYRTQVDDRLLHLKFAREVATKSEDYRRLVAQLSNVLFFVMKLLRGVEVTAHVPGEGERKIAPYAGLLALLSEAYLAYRFWSGKDWQDGLERVEASAKVLSRLLSDETKYVLRERNRVSGGDGVARSVVYMVRTALPSWYDVPDGKLEGFYGEVVEARDNVKRILSNEGIAF